MRLRLNWLAAVALSLLLVPPVLAQSRSERERERERAERERERAQEERERAREARDRARESREDPDDRSDRGDRYSGTFMDNCRRDRGDRDRVKFCEERSLGWRAQSGATLTVDASPNGGVSVSGWDRDSVHVEVKLQTQGGDDEEARELARQIRITNEGGRLRAEGPSSRRWASWSVSFVIFAPRRVDLDLSSVNGPLEVEEVVGRLRLEVQNGPLSLHDVGGDVRAHAQNGPLHVKLTGSRWEGTGLDASTQNGPLVLEVPEGYNAQLETGTINGPMEIGFPIMVQGRIGMGGRRHISTTLGSGGTTIRAVTTNGPAVIRRS